MTKNTHLLYFHLNHLTWVFYLGTNSYQFCSIILTLPWRRQLNNWSHLILVIFILNFYLEIIARYFNNSLEFLDFLTGFTLDWRNQEIGVAGIRCSHQILLLLFFLRLDDLLILNILFIVWNILITRTAVVLLKLAIIISVNGLDDYLLRWQEGWNREEELLISFNGL